MIQDKQVNPNMMQRPIQRRAQETSYGLTPKEVLAIVRRHIFLIICFTVFGLIAGGASWALLRKFAPKYTARTLVEVLPPIDKDPMDVRGILVNQELQYGYRVSIADLMRQQSTLMDLLQSDKVKETNWYNSFGQNTSEKLQGAYEDLEDHLRVSPSRESNFVVVSMTCGSSKEAALIVNEMVDLFVNEHGDIKKKEALGKLAVYNARLEGVQRELDNTERLLASTRESIPSGYLDLEQRGNIRDTSTLRLDNLQIQQDQLALEISQLRGIILSLQRQAKGPITEQVENLIETDPIMVTLAQQKALQESQLAGQLAKFGENHREVQRIQDQINEIEARREMRRREIAEQVRRSNLANAQDRLAALLQQFDELNKRKDEAIKQKQDVDRARVLYEQQKKTLNERQALLDSIKQQIEKQRMIADDPETAKVRKVGPALEPREISSPRWEFYFPGGIFLGFLCGLGLAFAIELLNDRVRTPIDVSRYLNIPLLGVIPDADEDGQVRDIGLCHVVRQAPYSIMSESYRRLRTNFELSHQQNPSKVILLGSGMPGEGNTTVAVNFASVLAFGGKKLLLVDGNFRRPGIEDVFIDQDNKENTQQAHKGLGDFLTGESTSQEVILSSPVQNIDIICAGTIPSRPSELLGANRMKELIDEQRDNYDYILIDGPPVLLVSDTKILASLVDGVLLIFNAGSTHRGAAQRTIRELRTVNASVIGCVLCSVKSLKGGYFREQFKIYRRYQPIQFTSTA